MGAHNNYENSLPFDLKAAVADARYSLSLGQRWTCPTCGDTPANVQADIPKAIATQVNGDEKQFHCIRCANEAEALRQTIWIREQAPRLVPVARDDASSTAPSA